MQCLPLQSKNRSPFYSSVKSSTTKRWKHSDATSRVAMTGPTWEPFRLLITVVKVSSTTTISWISVAWTVTELQSPKLSQWSADSTSMLTKESLSTNGPNLWTTSRSSPCPFMVIQSQMTGKTHTLCILLLLRLIRREPVWEIKDPRPESTRMLNCFKLQLLPTTQETSMSIVLELHHL